MPNDPHTRTRHVLVTPRSRGAVTGFALMLLGIWGAVIPFVGPYFNYAYTPNTTWTWTAARFWLEVLPGIVTFVGGLLLLTTANRVTAQIGGWAATLAGAWFVVGPVFNPLWDNSSVGTPIGGATTRAVEQVGIFFGLGAAIILAASFALGRFSVIGVRDQRVADEKADRDAARSGEVGANRTVRLPADAAGEPSAIPESGRGSEEQPVTGDDRSRSRLRR